MAVVYEINKGVNRSLEFKGIKAQYIIYLAAGMLFNLLFFSIAYMIGINTYITVVLVLGIGFGLFTTIQRYSKKYGEHGLSKESAQRRLPSYVTMNSRKLFIRLSEIEYEADKETGRSLPNMEG